jgi:hypothetical protein
LLFSPEPVLGGIKPHPLEKKTAERLAIVKSQKPGKIRYG